MIEIQPSKEQIALWIEKLVPERDMFFIEEKDLVTFEDYLDGTLVIPRNEFFKHSSYNTIQLGNSFTYWRISNQAKYIIVAQPSWITKQPEQVRRELLGIQVKIKRGLILPLSIFPSTVDISAEYIFDDHDEKVAVIQSDMWGKLLYSTKEHVMKAYAQQWDNWTCYEIPEKTPTHIKRYANSFTTVSGSNCLAAALFAITEQHWMIYEWVHPETFELGLKRANYSVVNDEITDGDVLVWVNDDDVIVHASYHIGNMLFFNKEGQTFFNPWKIIHFDELSNEWNQFKTRVYRKKQTIEEVSK